VLLWAPGPCHDARVTVDFGNTARDYAAYRTPFPAELFTRLAARGGCGVSGSPISGPGRVCWPGASPAAACERWIERCRRAFLLSSRRGRGGAGGARRAGSGKADG